MPTVVGKTHRRNRIPAPVMRLLGPLLLLFLWWLLTATGVIGPRTLAGPATVAESAIDLIREGELQEALWASLQRVVIGLTIGVTVGVVLAILSGLFRFGENLIDGPVQMFRSMPVLALTPLIIIWFGIQEQAKISLIAIATTFPIYLNTFSAIRGVDGKFAELAQTVSLSRWGFIRKVVVPGALPGFFVGLRFSLAIAWLILVFAETINARAGLGYLTNQAREFFQTDVIVVVLIVYALLGLLADAFVRLLERRTLSWRRGLVAS